MENNADKIAQKNVEIGKQDDLCRQKNEKNLRQKTVKILDSRLF